MKFKITKETLRKAGRTFVQAAIGYVATNLVYIVSSGDVADFDYLGQALLGLAMSAVAAGVAAVMNLEKKQEGDE